MYHAGQYKTGCRKGANRCPFIYEWLLSPGGTWGPGTDFMHNLFLAVHLLKSVSFYLPPSIRCVLAKYPVIIHTGNSRNYFCWLDPAVNYIPDIFNEIGVGLWWGQSESHRYLQWFNILLCSRFNHQHLLPGNSQKYAWGLLMAGSVQLAKGQLVGVYV